MRLKSVRSVRRALDRSQRKRLARLAALIAAGAAAGTGQAATITVNSLADAAATDAQCTLREALNNANSDSDTTGGDCTAGLGADIVQFQAGLTGTITLGGTQVAVTDSVTVNGPGAGVLTVSGNNVSRIFYVYNNTQALAVTISGLTLTQGNNPNGSAASDKGESLTMSAVTASGNTGDAVRVFGGGSLTLQNSTVTGTIAGRGIHGDHPNTVSISGSTISNNATTGKGGGLFLYQNSGAVAIDNSIISGNAAGSRGGGVMLYDTNGPVTITNSQITGNSSGNRGGGIALYKALNDVTIQNTTISGNTAATRGGGVFFYKQAAGLTLTIANSTISGNSLTGAAVGGGGIFFYKQSGTTIIEDTTISGNSAPQGGGIYDFVIQPTGTLVIRNSTINGNTATTDSGNVRVTSFPSVTITNSIVGNGTAPVNPDMQTGASNVVVNFSLIEDTTGATFTGANNIIGTDPQLGALANNGGPTFTHLPATGSPVINAGDPAFAPPPSTDQRGLARVVGGRVDMGSVELNGGTIQFASATFAGAEGVPNATITISRSGGTDPASVNYGTSNGSAIAPGDYAATSGVANFAAGATSTSFTVPIVDDLIFEGSQTFTVTLSSPPPHAVLGAQTTAAVTIADNDAPPTLSINNVSQNEGNSGTTPFNFTVTLSGASELTATVQYATANGTAIAPGDFASTSGMLTFAPGVTTQPINVLVNGETVFEPNEAFTVNLTAPVNATVSSGTGTGTIQNDDAPPALSIDNVSQNEGNSGTTPFNFTVTLSAASELTATVQYATANGTAIAPGDFAATSGTLTFAPGVTTQPINVLVNGETVFEPNEAFTVNLTAPVNATVSSGTGTGTIQNDDAPPALSINNVSQNEGNSGTTPFNFTVTLSGATELTTTVQYATANGTAVAPGDYAATSGTLTFAPGVTTQPINVLVNGETTFEPNEAFTVNLTVPVNATISSGTGTGTIQNDDAGNADVGIAKTAGGSAFFAGQQLTYNIAVSNSGPNAASAVVVTDVLPAGATFVSAVPSQGTCTGTTTVTCSLGVVANGGSATIALTVTPAAAGPLSNTATVSDAPQPDPNPANDSATAPVTVQPASAIPLFDGFMKILLVCTSAIIGLFMIKKQSS